MLPIMVTSILALAAPAAAQSPAASGGAPPPLPPLPDGWTQVTAGLDAPRGLTVTADGVIYVAESGKGGDAGCIEQPELGHMCFGPSGAIAKIEGGAATRVVEGLPSGITDTGETLGPSGVAVASDGTIWYTVGGPGVGAADLRATITGGEGIGQLYKVGARRIPRRASRTSPHSRSPTTRTRTSRATRRRTRTPMASPSPRTAPCWSLIRAPMTC